MLHDSRRYRFSHWLSPGLFLRTTRHANSFFLVYNPSRSRIMTILHHSGIIMIFTIFFDILSKLNVDGR
ncbi:hypothetical protein K503DRAFT_143242 [Rhizopogon vinicolor AM-OR11-026]|uniref:Uncharacterized protein n=1 Tax=Rhizopogon vinicolor AM-OR11-026 TaxID=1314800 RepID=A0A1B7N1G6_9AGAM|nr:hypothetical protein K503DRAFT_143242 [Rhizopogon vinicolor AM-OR11-026]